MLNLQTIRDQAGGTILVLGAHKPILQSILDFDYLCGKTKPSIVGIVTQGSKFLKLFYGPREVLIPCFTSIEAAAHQLKSVDWLLNINSGRRAYYSTQDFFTHFPDATGGHLFAEDTPEQFAIDLYNRYQAKGKTLVGPAGVGLLIPQALKLGAIGGTDYRQFLASNLLTPGNVAVLSASGGMINELIRMVADTEHSLSFALCFGGDRFPLTTPEEALLIAQDDPQTEAIVYYGELGGDDEYKLVELLKTKRVTKPVICYIAGVIGETFDQPIQFGHAKALARVQDETASAKRTALQAAGAHSAASIKEYHQLIRSLDVSTIKNNNVSDQATVLGNRTPSMFTSTISAETKDGYTFVGKTLPVWQAEGDFIKQILSGLLGREPRSQLTIDFTQAVFQLSIDHGPQVSGAVNTIVAARAGKNLVDSLAAGLLTIGPRFGGAVSGAATEWFTGVNESLDPKQHVEDYAKQGKYIMGIGHKKYRIGMPDPRVEVIETFVDQLKTHPHYDYAKSIEAITSAKKGNLILNIDGHIAALLLDILQTEEAMEPSELKQLIEADFFNAFFVIPRSIGFISHYLDQKRLDEGLFRLPDDAVSLN